MVHFWLWLASFLCLVRISFEIKPFLLSSGVFCNCNDVSRPGCEAERISITERRDIELKLQLVHVPPEIFRINNEVPVTALVPGVDSGNGSEIQQFV